MRIADMNELLAAYYYYKEKASILLADFQIWTYAARRHGRFDFLRRLLNE